MSLILFLLLLKLSETLPHVPKTVGGRPCDIHDHPYLVQIRTFEYRNVHDHFLFQGGGAILTPTIVLTVAHIVVVGEPRHVADEITVVAGEQMWHDHDHYEALGGEHRQLVDVTRHLVHDRFLTTDDPRLRFKFDIALLQVHPWFRFNDRVSGVDLPTRGFTATCAMGRSMGWGVTLRHNKRQVGQGLKCLDRRILPNELCTLTYTKHWFEVSAGQLCAWDPQQVSACQGDSGTPLVCLEGTSHVVIGLVSFGLHCVNSTGVYMRVEAWKGWIVRSMGEFEKRSKAMAVTGRHKRVGSGGGGLRNGVVVNVIIVMYALIINTSVN